MIALRCLVTFVCVATLVTAFKVKDFAKLDIVKSVEFEEVAVRAADVSQSSNTSEVIRTFQTSQGQVTSSSISCRGICSATMSYDLVIDGVSSEYLNKKDSTFRSLLDETQTTKYDNAKKRYKGGLGVTFLRAVGINLGGRYSRGNVNEAKERLRNYDQLANEARSIMNSFQTVTVRVFGSMRVTSYTSIQSEAVAYVKFAKVTLTDGRVLRVVSSSRADVKVIDSTTGAEMEQEDWTGGANQETDGDTRFDDDNNPIF